MPATAATPTAPDSDMDSEPGPCQDSDGPGAPVASGSATLPPEPAGRGQRRVPSACKDGRLTASAVHGMPQCSGCQTQAPSPSPSRLKHWQYLKSRARTGPETQNPCCRASATDSEVQWPPGRLRVEFRLGVKLSECSDSPSLTRIGLRIAELHWQVESFKFCPSPSQGRASET